MSRITMNAFKAVEFTQSNTMRLGRVGLRESENRKSNNESCGVFIGEEVGVDLQCIP